MSGNPTAAAGAQRGHPHYTRHAVTSAIAQSSSSSSAVADQQDGDDDAPDAETLDGLTIADLLKEMKAMRIELNKLKQQQSQQSLSFAPPPPSEQSPKPEPQPPAVPTDFAAFARAMQESQVRQVEQAFKQQAASSAQLLILQSLGSLPTFTGKGGDTTLIAHEWLQRAEGFFAAREHALGIDAVLGDQARLLNAAYALMDDARRWYDALPQRPSSWPSFRDAVKARFCSVPSERIRVDRLRAFVDKAIRLRDKLNLQGMQAFTAHFAQLAGQVSDDYVTQHEKLALLARALPQRYAETVLMEDAKRPLPPLHEVINTVLSRAAHREQAASFGGASTSSGSSASINLDAISLAVTTFGWTREEAQNNMIDSEGWAPHDTNGGSHWRPTAGPASAATPSPTPASSEQIAQLLNALAAHASRGGAGPNHRGSSVAKEIPKDLAEARKRAGLCIRCGVARYEPGGGGHNAATCGAAVDRTTSVAAGLEQADQTE
jgi:hypothetical protein